MEGFGGAGFSLWGLVLARSKSHRLKPAPLEPLALRAGRLSVILGTYEKTLYGLIGIVSLVQDAGRSRTP